jgi:hypothetical protein
VDVRNPSSDASLCSFGVDFVLFVGLSLFTVNIKGTVAGEVVPLGHPYPVMEYGGGPSHKVDFAVDCLKGSL